MVGVAAKGFGPRTVRKKSTRCAYCLLMVNFCICGEIPKIVTRTRLSLIIQCRETRKANNTGILAAKSLANSEVHVRGAVGNPLSLDTMLDEQFESLFLFPSDDAVELTPDLILSLEKPVKLFVADGNWSDALKIYRKFTQVNRIPSIVLPAGEPTQYRIRRPHGKSGGVATIEAIARALGIIEGKEVEDQLNQIFLLMVERTLQSRGLTP